jgi:hypothetical protein
VAEELLGGVRVDNVCVPGVGPLEYLYLLADEALPLEPDLVVVCIFVGNDLEGLGGWRETPGRGLRSWFERRKLLARTLVDRLAEQAAERKRLRAEAQPTTPWGGLTQGRRIEDEVGLAEAFPWILDPLLEQPSMSDEAFMSCETSRARDVCGEGADPYPLFFEVLEEIRRQASVTRFAVLLIPDEFQVEDAVWEAVRAALPGVELDRDRPQRRIRAWLEQRGVPYVDLLPRLRAVPPLADGRRHLYHLQDTHFNRRGNRIAGEALAELARAALGS